MGLLLPPHPDGELPLHYTATCEASACRPRLVRWFDTEEQRDGWVRAHTNGQDHAVTRGTARARRAP